MIDRTLRLLALALVLLVALPGCHDAPVPTAPPAALPPVSTSASTATDSLSICSFNIQFLGHFKKKDDTALASILAGYDVVVVQELVAPPYAGEFPNGSDYKHDPESAEFFDAMKAKGFNYFLSPEDTGTNDRINVNSTGTEWWVAFYKPNSVEVVDDLPHGFLADDRSNHPDYERVPYAFAFRSSAGNVDFVLISVHLQPGSRNADKARRSHELATIAAWIDANDTREKDFIILGDMNIEDTQELLATTPGEFISLNDECRATNTNPNGPKPYDHVMFRPSWTTEIDRAFDMKVVDLVDAMRPLWQANGPYPGDPYDHNEFKQWFSDHNPVVFRVWGKAQDDD